MKDLLEDAIIPLGDRPGEYVPHPRVIRRRKEDRPRREVEPSLEIVPPAPRRGWASSLRRDVRSLFARYGEVDTGDAMVTARNERRVIRA